MFTHVITKIFEKSDLLHHSFRKHRQGVKMFGSISFNVLNIPKNTIKYRGMKSLKQFAKALILIVFCRISSGTFGWDVRNLIGFQLIAI